MPAMTTSKTRTPFDLQTPSIEEGLSDKSADHGLEVKTLDDADDDADSDFLGPQSGADVADDELPVGDNAPADEPTSTVEMLHHYTLADGTSLIPGAQPTLPVRVADSLVTTQRAKRV